MCHFSSINVLTVRGHGRTSTFFYPPLSYIRFIHPVIHPHNRASFLHRNHRRFLTAKGKSENEERKEAKERREGDRKKRKRKRKENRNVIVQITARHHSTLFFFSNGGTEQKVFLRALLSVGPFPYHAMVRVCPRPVLRYRWLYPPRLRPRFA